MLAEVAELAEGFNRREPDEPVATLAIRRMLERDLSRGFTADPCRPLRR